MNQFARFAGICLSALCRSRKRCEKRCDSVYATNIQLRQGCYGACFDNPDIDVAKYLCGTANAGLVVQALQFDPCPNDEVGIGTVVPEELVDELTVDYTPFFIGGVAIIAILLIIMFTRK